MRELHCTFGERVDLPRAAPRLPSSAARVAPSSPPIVGLAPPIPWVCGSVVSGSDLSGVASESGAIVEGTSPDKSSTFNDADASQFNVTKVLKAIPGVHPSGPIEIVFGPPNSGDFLPAGKYLLFLEYNAIGNDYSIASSSFENVLTLGEFLINGAAATEKRCATPVSSGTPASATASANAAASPPSLPASQLEGFAGQLTIGTRARCGAIEHTASCSRYIPVSARFVVGDSQSESSIPVDQQRFRANLQLLIAPDPYPQQRDVCRDDARSILPLAGSGN